MLKNPLFSKALPIRNALLSIIRRAGAEATRLPSERFLAEKFGVNRSTVRLAIESINSGAILKIPARKGLYANPAFSTSIPHIVGITRLHDPFYLDASTAAILSAACEYFYANATASADFEFLQLCSTGENEICEELENLSYDAVILYGCGSGSDAHVANALISRGYPVIAVEELYINETPPIASNMIGYDPARIGRARAKLMLKEKRRGVVYAGAKTATSAAFELEMNRNGIEFNDSMLIESVEKIPSRLPEILRERVIDAIISDGPASRYTGALDVLGSKKEWRKIPVYTARSPETRRLALLRPENTIVMVDDVPSKKKIGIELAKAVEKMLCANSKEFPNIILS